VNILTTARVRPIVIQSMFVKINDFAPSPDEIAAYVDRLEDLVRLGARIKLVQIYTTARAPAKPGVSPLRDQELDCIVEQVRGKGLSAAPFYGISAP
jgi:hypothetical protein